MHLRDAQTLNGLRRARQRQADQPKHYARPAMCNGSPRSLISRHETPSQDTSTRAPDPIFELSSPARSSRTRSSSFRLRSGVAGLLELFGRLQPAAQRHRGRPASCPVELFGRLRSASHRSPIQEQGAPGARPGFTQVPGSRVYPGPGPVPWLATQPPHVADPGTGCSRDLGIPRTRMCTGR